MTGSYWIAVERRMHSFARVSRAIYNELPWPRGVSNLNKRALDRCHLKLRHIEKFDDLSMNDARRSTYSN